MPVGPPLLPELPELPLLPVFPVLPEVDVVAAAAVLLVERVEAEDVLTTRRARASAGSCPVTSVTVINSQAATNSVTAAAATRRLISRERSARPRCTSVVRVRVGVIAR